MSEKQQTQLKQTLLENPTDLPLDHFLILVDREAKEVSLFQATVPPQSTLNIAEHCPAVAAGSALPQLISHPGVTATEAVSVFNDLFGGSVPAETDVPGSYLARDGAIVGNLTAQKMLVTVVMEDRQPRADSQQYIFDELLDLPARSELTLSAQHRALYVLPAEATPRDIQKALAREWEIVGKVNKDGTLKKQQGRKKNGQAAQDKTGTA